MRSSRSCGGDGREARGRRAAAAHRLLDVCVPIEVDDADALGGDGGQAADRWEANRVVAAQDDGKGAGRADVGDGVGDLVKRLLDVARNGEHIASIAEGHLLTQVDAHLVVVRRVERGDSTDALRAEASGSSIKRHSNHRRVVLADETHILKVGSLHEGVDPREVWLLAPGERGDVPVLDGGGAREAESEAALHFPLVGICGQLAFLDGGAPALGGWVERVGVMVTRQAA
eukprot:scaffold140770_cov31-Tisochrysis_lutea.AAC.1